MRWLLYICVLLTVTAYGYSGSRRVALDEAQRLMHSDPSAALSKLNGVDVSEIRDSATMARWALLYSEAMVINRLSAPTDTIVNIALDYYGNHNLIDEYNKASRLKALMQSAADDTDALATALYLQKEKEFFLYKERMKGRMYMFGALLILLAAIGIIVGMRQRLRLQSLRNDALMAEASCLKSQVETSRGDVSRMEVKLHGLLDKRFSLIDSLCQTYYESQGTKSERKAIVDKVKAEIEAARNSSFPEMEQVVNDCRDNILEKIKESIPDIKPDDYMLLVFIASGLSTRTMSLLLGQSVDVIYKRKSRLKFRLKETAAVADNRIMDIF